MTDERDRSHERNEKTVVGEEVAAEAGCDVQ